jgi:hypothetical protein
MSFSFYLCLFLKIIFGLRMVPSLCADDEKKKTGLQHFLALEEGIVRLSSSGMDRPNVRPSKMVGH